MRLIIHDGQAVTNLTEVEDGWTGAEGQWQPDDGLFALSHETANIGWEIVAGKPVAPTAPVQDLAALKAFAREAIIARADAFTSPILSAYPEAERTGWDKRESEARSILAASDKTAAIAATVIIKSLSQAAGDDEAATIARAEKIVAKADQFAAISAAVEVMRDQSLTAIEAVTEAADMPTTLAALAEQATALAKQYGLA